MPRAQLQRRLRVLDEHRNWKVEGVLKANEVFGRDRQALIGVIAGLEKFSAAIDPVAADGEVGGSVLAQARGEHGSLLALRSLPLASISWPDGRRPAKIAEFELRLDVDHHPIRGSRRRLSTALRLVPQSFAIIATRRNISSVVSSPQKMSFGGSFGLFGLSAELS